MTLTEGDDGGTAGHQVPGAATAASPPFDEAARLAALYQSQVLDTEPERSYDDLTRIAASMLDMPIALISLVDDHRQWFKSVLGLGRRQTPRERGFCVHALQDPERIVEVEDARADPRFADNPLVTADPFIRYYAGAPIVSADGHVLGTLCVIDRRPRQLSAAQRQLLQSLAGIVSELLASRRLRAQSTASEAHFRALFESNHAAIGMFSATGGIVAVNDRFCDLAGRTREDLMRIGTAPLTHPDDVAENSRLRQILIDTGVPYTIEKRYLHPNGKVVWVRSQVSGVFDADGRMCAGIATVEDITERRAIERRINESEERFVNLAQQLSLKLWLADSEGRCIFINKAWCDFVGKPMDTQLGAGWRDCVHPQDLPGRIRKPIDTFNHEYRLRGPDGSYRWHQSTVQPRLDGEGQLLGYIGSVVDIHEQKTANEKLEREVSERTAMLGTILETMPNAVMAVDLDGRFIIDNQAAQDMCGVTRAETPDDPEDWTRLYHMTDRDGRVVPSSELPMMRALRGEILKDEEFGLVTARRPAGLTMSLSGGPLRDGRGQQFGALIVFNDVTERNRVEAERALSEARLEAVFNQSTIMQGLLHPDGRMVRGSETALAGCGWTAEQAIGKPFWQGPWWSQSEDTERQVRIALAAANSGKRYRATLDYFINGPEGPQSRRVDFLAQPIFAADGSLLNLFVAGLDVTESEQMRTQLGENARELEYFRLAADGTEDFFALAGLDRKVRYINPAGRAALGLGSMAAVRNTELLDYVFERDLPRATGEWLPALARDGSICVEIDMRHFVTAEPVPVLWRAFRLDDPATGEPYAIAAIGPLLKERRRVEAERLIERQSLAESESRLRAITETAPHIVFTTDANGAIDFFNDFASTYFGRTISEVSGWRWVADLVHPEDTARVMAAWMNSVITGEPLEVQYRLRRHDGEYRWHIARCVAQADAGGRPQCWYGVVTDIEDLRRAQAAAEDLRLDAVRSERYYRFISESTPHQVWTTDPEGRLDYVNRMTEEFLGKSRSELLRDGWLDDIHLDDVDRASAAWQHSIDTGETYSIEYRHRRHDGQYFWHSVRAEPLRDDRLRIVKWFGSSFNVEELKLARQRAEEAAQVKSTFLQTMSHEIRTPMNAVIGMASLLSDSLLSIEQQDAVGVIRSSGEHLLTVIDDILDYSKIEAGYMKLETEPFSLGACIESARDLVRMAAKARMVEIGYLIEPGTPDGLLGDPVRLRQVLVNLLSNAVKFSHERGQVLIQVQAIAVADEACTLEISVQDHGLGIDLPTQRRLFQPFVQADASIARVHGGSGLGLSISRRLVELMGGTISVRSEPGKGSIFRFSFNAVPKPASAHSLPQDPVPMFESRRALIIDGLEINRRILCHYLQLWGMTALATDSPAEALNWIGRGESFDVALIDNDLPNIDSSTLAQTIRQMSGARQPAILVLNSGLETAAAGEPEFAELCKPIKPSRLLERISQLLVGLDRVRTVDTPGFQVPRELATEHPLRILVAEDQLTNQKVALLMFRRMGYAVDIVANGEEAVAAVEHETYDVVFMDVQMPVLDGLAATRAICERHRPGERPLIVGLSANVMSEDREEGMLAGMDDYLPKPLRPELLVVLLRKTPRRGAKATGASLR